jgi:hypoxanthine phosphoribosyltransferase
MMNEFIHVTWNDIDELLDIVHEKIETPIDKIVGISRGGLIPGVMLSHRLGAGFEPLEWQTRDGHFKDTIKANNFNKNLNGTLFVDDICDSGKTITQIKEIIPDSRWAVLHQKADLELDFVGQRLYNENRWLIYPWEKI